MGEPPPGIPGCGWDPDLGDIAPDRPTWDNEVPCPARDGHRPANLSADEWNVGTVGLCRTCLEQPGDLLQGLAVSVAGRPPHE